MDIVLTCEEMTELVTNYLEEKMSLQDRLDFQKHIGLCRHCREYLHQMKVTVETLGAMPADPVPAEMMGDLLHKFRGWKERSAGDDVPACGHDHGHDPEDDGRGH